jgi:hypothetical protein
MNTQQLQLVTFEQAKRLKEAGFDWKTCYCYDDLGRHFTYENAPRFRTTLISAPTVTLALKWFRDVKNIYASAVCVRSCVIFQAILDILNKFRHVKSAYHDTHEAAESALLDKLLTLIKK